MIARSITDNILESLHNYPAAGLIGPRQAGKTTLAKHIANGHKTDSVYLDLENPGDFRKLDNAEFYLKSNSNKLVILDEAQRKPELFPLLRSLIDSDRKTGRFLILGSASPSLKRQSSESLAGRIAYHELTPFTFNETGSMKNDIHRLWLRGGYPLSYLADNNNIAFDWLENFIMTHLERDLPALGINIPSAALYRFWTMLAHCSGQTWNASRFAESLGVDSKTIRRYLDILEDTFMLRQLPPFFANTKKRLVKSPKVYIRDTGILHSLLRINDFDELSGHPILGASWEGWIIEQLNAIKPKNLDIFFYRTHAGAEIDLVFAKALEPVIAVEIKYSSSPKTSKSLYSVINDLKPQRTFIVYPGNESYPVKEDIWTMPADKLKAIFE